MVVVFARIPSLEITSCWCFIGHMVFLRFLASWTEQQQRRRQTIKNRLRFILRSPFCIPRFVTQTLFILVKIQINNKGKMGKTMKNSHAPKTKVCRKESYRKDSCSEIKKLIGSNVHALQEKYKNILGCRQPTVMLERCSISKNISHLNCLQVSSKNSVNNTCDTNDIRKLVHSTNHVSHKSPCVEKTNLASLHSFKVKTPVRKINYELSSIIKASENVLQISKTRSKRDALLEQKSIPKIDKSDSISSLDKIMGGQLQENNLNESVAKPLEYNTNTAAGDAIQPCKRTKIYISTESTSTDSKSDIVDIPNVEFSMNGTLISDNRNKEVASSLEHGHIMPLQEREAIKQSIKSVANTSLFTENSCSSIHTLLTLEKFTAIELQEKLIELQEKLVPRSNELSKHAEKCAAVHTQKSMTIMEDTKDKLSTSNTSFINSCTDTSEKFIVPSSNELSKHTRKRRFADTQKSITMEDNVSMPSRNFINFSTNDVQLSGTSVTLQCNDSNKQTKESTVVNIEKSIKAKKEIISEENNVEHDASHDQDGQKSMQSQKREHSANSSNTQNVKKVKLNRTNWNRRLETVNNAVDTSKDVDRTEKIVELKDHDKISQPIRRDVPGPSIEFPEGDNITCDVQVSQAKNEEQSVSSIEKQTSTETFGYSNRVECNDRAGKVATENHIPVSENTSFSSENRYFNNNVSLVDEDDCISLFADSMIIEEYDIPEVPQSRRLREAPQSRRSKETPQSRRSKEAPPLVMEKQYVMTDKVIDNYYRKNALEFNEAYNINYSNNSKTQIVPQRERSVKIVLQKEKPVEIIPQKEKPVGIVPETKKLVGIVSETKKPAKIISLMKVELNKKDIARLTLNPQIQTLAKTRINQSYQNGLFRLFRGFCYKKLRTGACYATTCNYSHNFAPFLLLLHNRNETRFFKVMDDLIQQQFIPFLKSFYKECIRNVKDVVCILKLLKKFCTSNIISLQIVFDTIKELIMHGVTVNQIVDILLTVVDASDTQFVTSMSKVLVNYIVSGNGWSTLKPLIMRIDKLDEDIIQLILAECILTQKNVQDVYENVVCKLDNESLTLFNKRLVLQFHSIHRQIQENLKVEEKVASTYVTIASPNPLNEPHIIPYTIQTDNLSPSVWKDVHFDRNNNVQGGSSTALLHPIDNVPSPYSKRSRERFWKFYLDVHSLQEGLKHNDYRHVKKILDEAERRHTSPFTTACYNVLRRTVEHSQTHLSKLVSLAVQDGATATFFKTLIDVTIHILADMAERELWVLALLLLNSMEGILHEQSSFHNYDAVVTMLFCEIYLANRKPMKAFNLLKESNILYTYRGKWKVRNNEKDDDIRAQIVTILLDMFCDTSPEYAFSLFEFLIEDQSSNFYPIDLTYPANKLVKSLLLKNDHELIINIGKLIDHYNCTLYPIMYRALISSLVRIDLPLAKQVYQSAVLLGIYPEIQLYPIMYVIVKSDWTSEEMYLTIWAMMHKLFENLGHAIEGVKRNNLCSYLVFEATPSNRQHVTNMDTNKKYKNKIHGSVNLMRKVLKTEFRPPLLLVKKRIDKLQKISCSSLYAYLKHNQMNCM